MRRFPATKVCTTCVKCNARFLFPKLRNLRKTQAQVLGSQNVQPAVIARPGCYFSDCASCGNCKTMFLFCKTTLSFLKLRKLQDQVATSQIVQLVEMLVLIHKIQYKVYQIVICKKSNCMEGKCWPYLGWRCKQIFDLFI